VDLLRRSCGRTPKYSLAVFGRSGCADWGNRKHELPAINHAGVGSLSKRLCPCSDLLSKSSTLTGEYLQNGGAFNNSISGHCYGVLWKIDTEKKTFAVYAQQAGYQTGYLGKYLNEYGLQKPQHAPPGWTKWQGLTGNSRHYNYSMVIQDKGDKEDRFCRTKPCSTALY